MGTPVPSLWRFSIALAALCALAILWAWTRSSAGCATGLHRAGGDAGGSHAGSAVPADAADLPPDDDTGLQSISSVLAAAELFPRSLAESLLLRSKLPPILQRQIKSDLSPWRESNVTLAMVEQAYCSSFNDGLRFQSINGSMHISGLTIGWETRMLSITRMLYKLGRLFHLPDVDLVLEQPDLPSVTETSEACPIRGPIFHHFKVAGSDGRHIVRIPDHSYFDWVEKTMLLWEEEHAMLVATAQRLAWADRLPHLFFIGDPNSDPRRKRAVHAVERWRAARRAANDSVAADEIDVRGTGRVYFLEHCRRKYLLHMPGLGNSGRYKYLLGCGSAVIDWQMKPYSEWWFALLENGTNVLQIPWREDGDPAEQLYETVERLKADDEFARQLGQGGLELFREGLHPRNVYLYLYHLLKEYATMQDFQPTVHPDAVPIEQVLNEMARETKLHSERTCKMCPLQKIRH